MRLLSVIVIGIMLLLIRVLVLLWMVIIASIITVIVVIYLHLLWIWLAILNHTTIFLFIIEDVIGKCVVDCHGLLILIRAESIAVHVVIILVHLIHIPIDIILILQLLNISSRSCLLVILLRQSKQQTIASLSYILPLLIFQRLLNTINFLYIKRFHLPNCLWFILIILIPLVQHIVLVHFGKCLIHLS